MEGAKPYLEMPLADGRWLVVGPLANISTEFPGEGTTFAMVHRFACFVTAHLNQDRGPRSIVRGDGSVAGDLVTVAEAVKLAPHAGVEIVNAAARMLGDYYGLADSIRLSTDLRERLTHEYIARYGKAFRAEIDEAEMEVRFAFEERRAGALADAENAGDAQPFAIFRLDDGRNVFVGPYVMYAAESFDDGERVETPLHALGCAVTTLPDAPVGPQTLVDAEGAPIAEWTTLEAVAQWLPDIAADVVAAAHRLVESTLAAVDEVKTSDVPEHRLFRTYAADNLAAFARDTKAAEKIVLRRAHAEMSQGLDAG